MKIKVQPLARLLALLFSFNLLAVSVCATTYQAESATISQGNIDSNHAGYTGTGFVNYINVTGSYVEFAVSTANTGSHTLTFRYANGTGANRPMEIKVDGVVVSSALAFNDTGAWSTWADKALTVTLSPGSHTVRATATTADGGPNLDKLDLSTGGGPSPDFSQIGWSTLNGGTTGGSTSTVVNVSTVAALQAAASSSTSQTIRITAPLTTSSVAVVNITSNKTIVGDGLNGVLQGIEFTITGNTSNVIIRNLKMTLTNLADPDHRDLIKLWGNSGPIRNIWIDHCEFYSESPDVQTDPLKYDGMIDLTKDVAFVTISWCYFRDHWKANLVGESETDNFDRRITFHHNRYDYIIDRCPTYRYGQGHVYNSYFIDVGRGVNIREGATIRAEANVFESSKNPIIYTIAPLTVSYVDLGAGGSFSNQYIDCTGSQPTSSTGSLTIPYTYTLDATSVVKNTVLTWAGFGKITP